jgi:hypothetical protein
MTMNEPADDDRMLLPGHFPIWPGVLAALLVGGALAGADRLGLFPAALGGLAGRVMIAAHALVALALVTLLGQAARITGLRRELAVCRDLPDDQRSGWPVEALRDSLKRLYKRQSSGETRAEIARTAKLILKRQQGTWQLALWIAYLIPAIGFAMTLWGLQIHGNSVPWLQVGLPLMVGLGESIPVLLLAIGVRKAARETAADWQQFAEELAIERRTRAARAETKAPDDDEGAGTTRLPDDERIETLLPKAERKEPVAAKGLKKEPPEAMKKDPAPPRV